MDDALSPAATTPDDDAYAHVGQELRRMRLERGLTQSQVAQVIAVSPQQYQKYEDAQSKCSLNYLIALADHFGVTVHAFLPGGAPVVASQPPETEIANEADLLARLVTAFVRLDDADEKLRFVQLVEAVGAAHQRRT